MHSPSHKESEKLTALTARAGSSRSKLCQPPDRRETIQSAARESHRSRRRLKETAQGSGNPRRTAVANRRSEHRGGDQLAVAAQDPLPKLDRGSAGLGDAGFELEAGRPSAPARETRFAMSAPRRRHRRSRPARDGRIRARAATPCARARGTAGRRHDRRGRRSRCLHSRREPATRRPGDATRP